MAAAVTPERSKVCAQTCSHAGCEAVRRFAAIGCVLCGQPIDYAAELSARPVGGGCWAHRACVLAVLDTWERIGQEVTAT